MSASKIVIHVVFQIRCNIISEQSLAIDHIEWYQYESKFCFHNVIYEHNQLDFLVQNAYFFKEMKMFLPCIISNKYKTQGLFT